MPKEKPTGATTAAAPLPPTIPEETTAQPSISHTEEPQVSIGALSRDQSHAETGPITSTAERDAEETGEQEKSDNLAEEKANEGEIPGSGEKDEGETPFVSVEGGTPFVFAEGETPEKSVGVETPVNIEVQEPEEGGLK